MTEPSLPPNPDAPPPDLGNFVLCLNVTDLSASRDFYGRLGFDEIGGDPSDGWCMLRRDTLELHIFQGHITSTVLNFRDADVALAAEAIKARGIALEVEAHVEEDGTTGAWLRDPDGNSIYLNT